jgi:hypothetical protein
MVFARAPVEHHAYKLITRILDLRTSDHAGVRVTEDWISASRAKFSFMIHDRDDDPLDAAAISHRCTGSHRNDHRDSAPRCEFSFAKVEWGLSRNQVWR